MVIDSSKPLHYSGKQCKQLWLLLHISRAELARRMGTNPQTGYEYTEENLRYWMSREHGMPDLPFADFLRVVEEVLQARIENIKRAEALRTQLEQFVPPFTAHPAKKPRRAGSPTQPGAARSARKQRQDQQFRSYLDHASP